MICGRIARGAALMAALDSLAEISDDPGCLTRLYLSSAHRRAAQHVKALMRAAGMAAEIDAVGNVVGRYPGRCDLPSLMLGSHIDTVRDAGKFDGSLGVLAAIAVVRELAENKERLRHPIEVVAFGEEEGVRFPTYLLTSRSLAGRVGADEFDARDEKGMSVREALAQFGGDADAFASVARKPGAIAAYVELHIEQGPVLEAEGRALGIVTAINGAARLHVDVTGVAGHSGTVPMLLRQDALAAAAEMVLAVEQEANSQPELVATVGVLDTNSGAVNVIPGHVRFSIDIRHPDDALRKASMRRIEETLASIAERRRVRHKVSLLSESRATVMDSRLIGELETVLRGLGQSPHRLNSGAGHDAMVLASLCPAAMVFLRCRGGISHNPLEMISREDAELAVEVLLETVRRFDRAL
jgi:allantoate deiminase